MPSSTFCYGCGLWEARTGAHFTRNKRDSESVSGRRQSLVLPSRPESIDQAESAAEQAARSAGFDEQELYRIAMAVREITMNAIAHGNRYDANKTVSIEFVSTPQELAVHIADQGTGFNANDLPDPLAPENLLRQSGRGVFIARAFMDDVKVESGSSGTRVHMVKRKGKRD